MTTVNNRYDNQWLAPPSVQPQLLSPYTALPVGTHRALLETPFFLFQLLSLIEGIKLWLYKVKLYKRIHVFSPYLLLPF